jgi:hypothetical protein
VCGVLYRIEVFCGRVTQAKDAISDVLRQPPLSLEVLQEGRLVECA